MRRFALFFAAVLLFLFVGCATPPESGREETEPGDRMKMYLIIHEHKLEVTLADNSSVDALVARLKEGDITFSATENGGFEIYGSIGQPLPTNNTNITAHAGDVLLYSGHYICIFFGSNTWSYTRIGTINGDTMPELQSLLGGATSVQVTISLQ